MIPFLDMMLIRTHDRKIITNWYGKPISANNILNFLSAHPYHQKINVASNLAKRILQLSDHKFHTDNTTKIQNILLKNNYPIHIINKIIQKTKYQLIHNNPLTQPEFNFQSRPLSEGNNNTNEQPIIEQQQPQPLINEPDTEQQQHTLLNPPINNTINIQDNHSSNYFYTSLTYIPHLSDNIRQLVKSSDPDTKIAFKSTKTIKDNIHANMKQKISTLKQSSIVYKIDCAEDNCGISYLGETKRQLEVRTSEHERNYRIRFTPSPKTGLINHCLDTGHSFDFENIKIVDKENNTNKRRIIESAHIILNNPLTCNLKQDTNNIHHNYNNTLRIYKSISPKFKKTLATQRN